jgi:hypothetical protein
VRRFNNVEGTICSLKLLLFYLQAAFGSMPKWQFLVDSSMNWVAFHPDRLDGPHLYSENKALIFCIEFEERRRLKAYLFFFISFIFFLDAVDFC